jgi:hypothetical protein
MRPAVGLFSDAAAAHFKAAVVIVEIDLALGFEPEVALRDPKLRIEAASP